MAGPFAYLGAALRQLSHIKMRKLYRHVQVTKWLHSRTSAAANPPHRFCQFNPMVAVEH